MVGLGRLELPTSRLSGVRSNQLSYRPVRFAPKPAVSKSQTLSFTLQIKELKELNLLISKN